MELVPIIKIADRDTMMEKLLKVNDDPKLIASFYPKLATLAGEYAQPETVVCLIEDAIGEYTQSLEPDENGMPAACYTLPRQADAYFSAMIDNVLPAPAATAQTGS